MFDCFDSMDLTESFYYCHAYGAIVDDEYKLFFPESWVYCDSIYPRFFMGRNVFETMGYGDCKKYYGNNCFGIENENGEIVLIRDDVICSYDEIEPGIYFAKSSPIAPEFNYLYHLYNEEEPICDKCYKQRVLTLEEQKGLMGWGMEDRKFGDYIYTNKVYVRSH